MPRKATGVVLDPEFRTERARKASAAGNGAKGVITRFLRLLEAQEFTDTQIDIIRRALPPVTEKAGH